MPDNRLGNLINCKKCGRLFSANAEGDSFCSRCNQDVDNEFTKVREYIYDNPSSSVKDVSLGTGIKSEIILKWIRDGKIVLGENHTISICERCGEPIDGGGRFCPKCVKNLTDGLKDGIKSEPQRKSAVGMHIKEKK